MAQEQDMTLKYISGDYLKKKGMESRHVKKERHR